MKLQIWNVLAAAYKARNPKSYLQHAVEVDENEIPIRVLCGRVKLEHLCEDITHPYAGIESPRWVITCKTCAALAERLNRK